MSGVQAEARRGLSDEIAGAGAGLELGVVQDRTGQDDPAQGARIGALAGDEAPPGEPGRAAGLDLVHGAGEGLDRPGKIAQRRVSAGDALQRGGEGLAETPQAGVGGQGAQERLGGDQLAHVGADRGVRLEQYAVLLEERSGVGPLYIVEQVRSRREPGGQRRRRGLGELRRAPVDHHDDPIAFRIEQFVEPRLALAIGQGPGKQLVGVGGHGEMTECPDQGAKADGQAQRHDHPRPIAPAGRDRRGLAPPDPGQ